MTGIAGPRIGDAAEGVEENLHDRRLQDDETTIQNPSRQQAQPAYRPSQVQKRFSCIGDTPWEDTQRIQNASFSPSAALYIFDSKNFHQQAYGESQLNLSKKSILEVDLPDYSIDIFWAKVVNGPTGRISNLRPMLSIDFKEPISIKALTTTLNCITSFLSLLSGEPVVPREISVMDMSIVQFEKLGKNGIQPNLWSLDTFYKKDRAKNKKDRNGLPLYDFFLDDGKSCFVDALTLWVKRFDGWEKSIAHMMSCLWRRTEFSADRLLSACRWLEDLPDAKPLASLAKQDIESIVKGAKEAAGKLSRPDLGLRIEGSLLKISNESRREQFRRLCQLIDTSSLAPITTERFMKDLVFSQKVRGTAAHSLLRAKDLEEQRKFISAIEALEALCFLLTIRDLPKVCSTWNRTGEHHFLRMYRHS